MFLIASCHGALHWSLATFYVLLPFIQQHLGLSYAQTVCSPPPCIWCRSPQTSSGALVDVTGRRMACQMTALVFGGIGMGALMAANHFWMVMVFVGVLAAMNTLWHPAAISFLSSTYPERRATALSYHTVGASVGDALAPVAIGVCVSMVGWQAPP